MAWPTISSLKSQPSQPVQCHFLTHNKHANRLYNSLKYLSLDANPDTPHFIPIPEGLSNIESFTATGAALATVSLDGRVITWDKSDAGGDSEAVKELLVAKAEAEVKQEQK